MDPVTAPAPAGATGATRSVRRRWLPVDEGWSAADDLARLLASAGIAVAAVGLKVLVVGVLGGELGYLSYIGAVALGAWIAGLRGGLLATVICAVAQLLLFYGTSASAASPSAELNFVLFLIDGTIVSVLSSRLRRAYVREHEARAAQASDLHARAALHQAAERNRAALTRLQAVTASLAGAATEREVADAILDRGLAALGAIAGGVSHLTEDGRAVETIAVRGYEDCRRGIALLAGDAVAPERGDRDRPARVPAGSRHVDRPLPRDAAPCPARVTATAARSRCCRSSSPGAPSARSSSASRARATSTTRRATSPSGSWSRARSRSTAPSPTTGSGASAPPWSAARRASRSSCARATCWAPRRTSRPPSGPCPRCSSPGVADWCAIELLDTDPPGTAVAGPDGARAAIERLATLAPRSLAPLARPGGPGRRRVRGGGGRDVVRAPPGPAGGRDPGRARHAVDRRVPGDVPGRRAAGLDRHGRDRPGAVRRRRPRARPGPGPADRGHDGTLGPVRGRDPLQGDRRRERRRGLHVRPGHAPAHVREPRRREPGRAGAGRPRRPERPRPAAVGPGDDVPRPRPATCARPRPTPRRTPRSSPTPAAARSRWTCSSRRSSSATAPAR